MPHASLFDYVVGFRVLNRLDDRRAPAMSVRSSSAKRRRYASGNPGSVKAISPQNWMAWAVDLVGEHLPPLLAPRCRGVRAWWITASWDGTNPFTDSGGYQVMSLRVLNSCGRGWRNPTWTVPALPDAGESNRHSTGARQRSRDGTGRSATFNFVVVARPRAHDRWANDLCARDKRRYGPGVRAGSTRTCGPAARAIDAPPLMDCRRWPGRGRGEENS
jgi:hypothetical protein